MTYEQINHLVSTYGYVGVLVGTFLEGDIAMLVGGVIARLSEHIDWIFVAIAGMTGAFASDQFFFFLGRHRGAYLLELRPTWKGRAQRIFAHLHRHGTLVAIGFRFVYGFRILTPLLLGSSRFPRGRFVLLNLVGVSTWACSVSIAGFLMGAAAQNLYSKARRDRLWILLGLIVAGILVHLTIWLARRARARRRGGAGPREAGPRNGPSVPPATS